MLTARRRQSERCRSGRTGRSRKPLSLLRGTEGSNPSLSATFDNTEERISAATSPLSPQKDKGRDEPESASPGMESAPPLDHAPRFGRGGLRRRIHQTPV